MSFHLIVHLFSNSAVTSQLLLLFLGMRILSSSPASSLLSCDSLFLDGSFFFHIVFSFRHFQPTGTSTVARLERCFTHNALDFWLYTTGDG